MNELDLKIKDADKRMVAHPNFLKELQAIVEKYQGQLRHIFLSEDFSDGNYTRGPTWTVLSGQFKSSLKAFLFGSSSADREGAGVKNVKERQIKIEMKNRDVFMAISSC